MRRPQHLVGHRGALGRFASFGPEALSYVVRKGVRAIEVDVRVTADAQVVCSYASEVDTHGAGPGTGLVSIERSTASELAQMGIMTLESVLDRLAGGTEILIEMKCASDGHSGLPAALARLLDGRLAAGRCDRVRSVSSFDEGNLLAFRNSTSHFVHAAALLVRSDTSAIAALERVDQLDLSQAHLHTSVLLPHLSVVEFGISRGIAVTAWVCNDLDESLRLLRAGVERIITDDPIALAEGWRASLGAGCPDGQ